MILLLAGDIPITNIASMAGISRRFVYKWAKRFLDHGVAGLADQAGRGRRRKPCSDAPLSPEGV
jgi:transposase